MRARTNGWCRKQILCGFACAMLVPGLAGARYWTNTEGGDFLDGDNWLSGAVPAGHVWGYVNAHGEYTVHFSSDAGCYLDMRPADEATVPNVTFDLRGNTFTTLEDSGSTGFQMSLNASLTLLDGTFHVRRRTVLSFSGAEDMTGDPLTRLTVGEGATANLDYRVQVGYRYASEMNVIDGGVVNVGDLFYAGLHSTVYRGTATVTVDGDGSTLRQTAGAFYLGVRVSGDVGGAGHLVITNSGWVDLDSPSSNTSVFIGNYNGAVGSILVSGGAEGAEHPSRFTASSNRRFFLGFTAGAEGSFRVEDGGQANINAPFQVGHAAGGQGSLTVTGSGSTAEFGGEFNIGNSGTGTLLVEDGGRLTVGASGIAMALGAGSSGTATVSGTGSEVHTSGALSVGGGAEAGGAGTLVVGDGASVTAGGVLRSCGTVRIGGGTIEADSITLYGDSTLEVTLGKAGAGALLTAAGDAFEGGGHVQLQQGAFTVSVGAEFDYAYGSVFRVIGFETLDGTHNRFDGLDDGALLMASNNPDYGFQLNYGTLAGYDDQITLTAVIPEPGTLGLLAMFGALTALRMRGRRGLV